MSAAVALLLAGCSGGQPYSIPFMPPPAFLEAGEIPPFSDHPLPVPTADPRLFYATVRIPSRDGDPDRFYTKRRATEIRLGISRVVLGDGDLTWDMARRLSVLKDAPGRYPLQVADVEEFGVLDRTAQPLLGDESGTANDPGPRLRFVAGINQRLARSRDKDIFLYVHGYKVNFENPVLVAAELWHFLGYEGVFVPFAWPSRVGRLDYFGDTESARYSARYLREFIEFLAEETDARRIHILGYSAGTRLVAASLHQLALVNAERSTDEIRRRLRLGNTILVGSDLDRGIFTNYLLDGLLRMQQHLLIYESPRDKALAMALFAFGNERVGQLDPGDLAPAARRFLLQTDELALVSVANAPGYDAGKGHSYFRDSPLVSSDVLATLRYEFSPAERGLIQSPETGVWEFPPDYLGRLEAAVFAADPELARRAGGKPSPAAGTR